MTATYVEAPLRYTARTAETAVLYEFDRERSTHIFDTRPTRVWNARLLDPAPALERNGFTLVRHETRVADFYDPDQVRGIYYPEAERIVRDLTGAARVLVFGEALRTEGAAARTERLPARNAHVDFNLKTVRWFVQQLLPDEAPKLLRRRCQLINLWRPVKPILRTPLAVCDASTVEAGDLMLGEIGHKPDDPDGPRMEGYNIAFNPHQRWYYYPRMQTDEVLAFKLCDSDEGAVQWTAHTAFDPPDDVADAPPRESLEVRTIAFL